MDHTAGWLQLDHLLPSGSNGYGPVGRSMHGRDISTLRNIGPVLFYGTPGGLDRLMDLKTDGGTVVELRRGGVGSCGGELLGGGINWSVAHGWLNSHDVSSCISANARTTHRVGGGVWGLGLSTDCVARGVYGLGLSRNCNPHGF